MGISLLFFAKYEKATKTVEFLGILDVFFFGVFLRIITILVANHHPKTTFVRRCLELFRSIVAKQIQARDTKKEDQRCHYQLIFFLVGFIIQVSILIWFLVLTLIIILLLFLLVVSA